VPPRTQQLQANGRVIVDVIYDSKQWLHMIKSSESVFNTLVLKN